MSDGAHDLAKLNAALVHKQEEREPSEAAMRVAWEIWDANDCTPEALVDRIARALDRRAAAQREKDAKIAWDFSAEAAAAIRSEK